MPMARFAKQHKRHCVAVDSFAGMAEPTDRDRDADKAHQYSKGSLAGGAEAFDRVSAEPNAIVFRGFVPEILFQVNVVAFAFVHLDLDHYAPTVAALDWLWPRMSRGGIIAAHDWFPHVEILASAAIKDWAAKSGAKINNQLDTRHAYFRKDF